MQPAKALPALQGTESEPDEKLVTETYDYLKDLARRHFYNSMLMVLDPFCGSGTTCIAAKLLKRRYLGIELNSDYHEIATKRVNAA